MKTFFIAAVLCLGASVASAEGLYVGGALYTSKVDDAIHGVSIDDRDTVPSVFVGYRFNNYVAAEAGYYDLGKYSDNLVKFEARAATLAAVGVLPLGLVDVYGKLGLAYIDAKSEALNGLLRDRDKGTEAFAALGVALNLGEHVDLFVEYQLFDYDARIDMLGVGVRFAF